MKFDTWIKQRGISQVAKDLKVSPRAVYFWLQRASKPKFKLWAQIHVISRGRVSYKDLLNYIAG